jgi:truncated hemoglobin YjbI
MSVRSVLLEALGGEEGCRRLAAAFYARIGKEPVLRPFFPGKSLKCATKEFAAQRGTISAACRAASRREFSSAANGGER